MLKNHETLRLEFVHYDFKPLKKRKEWNGVWVDSLTDIAANKTMALIGRYEPKDAFDIYYLIHEGKFTPAKLTSLAKKKFGMGIPLSSFWERALHASKGLNGLRPLIHGNKNQQNHLLKEIQTYFEREAARELRKHLLE
ncbi:MAG: hypothetical protein EPN85_03255 [Bacteroidetes bacterium]|nr:MAG: hypothetical protein EPN85_03255 [Bacteroidota bacterium]